MEMKILSLILIFLLSEVDVSSSKNILVTVGLAAGSHEHFMYKLSRRLLAHGHNITFIRWKTDNHIGASKLAFIPNFHFIELSYNNTDGQSSDFSEEEHGAFLHDSFLQPLIGSQHILSHIVHALCLDYFFWKAQETQIHVLFSNKHLIDTLNGSRFDVAVIDLLMNDWSLIVANELNIPVIGALQILNLPPTAAPVFPSYMPVMLSTVPGSMSFIQRAWNVFLYLGYEMRNSLHFSTVNRLAQEYFPGTPPMQDLLKNLSGVLISNSPLLYVPTMLPPTFLHVPGLHIEENQPLPQDLEEWMVGSGEAGVIYFSLGYNLNNYSLPDEMLYNYMQAFSLLSQRIVFVYNNYIGFIPENVMVYDWVPQQDILNHNKTRVFISHCGLKSLIEALHFAVPVIGLPMYIDQFDNMVRVLDRQIGAGPLTLESSTSEVISTIREVLDNAKYKKNVERLSRIHHRKPDPMKKTLQLIELVAETKGLHDMKLPIQHLNWFQLYLVDVILFLMVVLLILLKILLVLIQKCRKPKKLKMS